MRNVYGSSDHERVLRSIQDIIDLVGTLFGYNNSPSFFVVLAASLSGQFDNTDVVFPRSFWHLLEFR